MKQNIDPPTAEEISAAYRKARLRYAGVSLFKALNTPSTYKSLQLQAIAMRKQHYGTPAPLKQAA